MRALWSVRRPCTAAACAATQFYALPPSTSLVGGGGTRLAPQAIISGPCEPQLLEQCPQTGAGVRMILPLLPASLQSPILTCLAAHG